MCRSMPLSTTRRSRPPRAPHSWTRVSDSPMSPSSQQQQAHLSKLLVDRRVLINPCTHVRSETLQRDRELVADSSDGNSAAPPDGTACGRGRCCTSSLGRERYIRYSNARRRI